GDHRALVRWQGCYRAFDLLPRLPGQECHLWHVPMGWRACPVSGVLLSRREEAFRLDRWFRSFGSAGERGKGDDSPLPLAPPLRLVGENAKQPGPKRRPSLEAADPLQHPDPGLLRDLLGHAAV